MLTMNNNNKYLNQTSSYNSPMRLKIPNPPDLKPTIIQMQTISSISGPEDYQSQFISNSSPQQVQKRRRRRSSSTSLASITPSELAQRQKEHKTAHSNIEKKRRIKMNREFEALKFLVPAIRNNLIGSTGESLSNGEQLYKLTILQSSVDYIRYLHKVIIAQDNALKQQQQQPGETSIDEGSESNILSFASVDIDTESYRNNLEVDYDFKKLFEAFNSTDQSSILRIDNKQKNISPSLQPTRFDTCLNLPLPTTVASQMKSKLRTTSLPNPSKSSMIYRSNSSSSSTPLLSAEPSPLISPKNNVDNFQFQFPLMYSNNITPTINSEYQIDNLTTESLKNQENNNIFKLPLSALPPIIISNNSDNLKNTSISSNNTLGSIGDSLNIQGIPVNIGINDNTSKTGSLSSLLN